MGLTRQRGIEILRRNDVDYVMVAKDSQLTDSLERLSGFTPVETRQREVRSLCCGPQGGVPEAGTVDEFASRPFCRMSLSEYSTWEADLLTFFGRLGDRVVGAPSILAADFANLAEEVRRAERGGADARPLRCDGQPLRPQPYRRPRRRGLARRGRGPPHRRPPAGDQP